MRLDSAASGEEVAQSGELALPRAAARVLAACASSSQLCVELAFRDPLSERIFECLGGDFQHFAASELRSTAYRAELIDRLAFDFFERTPDALGVGVWPLLGTRGHRLPGARWVDVDSPAVAELRRHLLPERRGWMQLAGCLCNSAWVDAVCGRSSLIAFDAEAVLRPSCSPCCSPALELVLPESSGGECVARYPRLRFMSDQHYPERLRSSLAGVNAISRAYRNAVPALAHLRVI